MNGKFIGYQWHLKTSNKIQRLTANDVFRCQLCFFNGASRGMIRGNLSKYILLVNREFTDVLTLIAQNEPLSDSRVLFKARP